MNYYLDERLSKNFHKEMKEETKRISEKISEKIHEIDPAARVILYGSRARGEEREDSDWDILVLTDYPVDVQAERTFRNHLYELELALEETFSLFVYSKEQWESKQRITPFYQFVEAEGVTI